MWSDAKKEKVNAQLTVDFLTLCGVSLGKIVLKIYPKLKFKCSKLAKDRTFIQQSAGKPVRLKFRPYNKYFNQNVGRRS